jgi:hypothetical protein
VAERRRSRRDRLADLLDERVVDAHIAHRAREGARRRADRQAEEGDEEQPPEEQTPQGAAQRSLAGQLVEALPLGLLQAQQPIAHLRRLPSQP